MGKIVESIIPCVWEHTDVHSCLGVQVCGCAGVWKPEDNLGGFQVLSTLNEQAKKKMRFLIGLGLTK